MGSCDNDNDNDNDDDDNYALYNIKNYINYKKYNHCVNNDFPKYIPCSSDAINNSCRRSRFLNCHYKRESSVSDIKKKQIKKE